MPKLLPILAGLAAVAALALLAKAQLPVSQTALANTADVEKALKASWPKAAPDWQARLQPDETMTACNAHGNSPPKAVGDQILAREKARIKYPEDGKLMGDWKKGERIAQSGYGLRFTDYPATGPNGGNCYACHQLEQKELSFGTVGPSLQEYGKIRKFAEADVKAVYDRIYNPQAAMPCGNMPRLGANGILTMEQIKDVVAYVMSPESPVNK